MVKFIIKVIFLIIINFNNNYYQFEDYYFQNLIYQKQITNTIEMNLLTNTIDIVIIISNQIEIHHDHHDLVILI